MDPTANLREQIDIADEIIEDTEGGLRLTAEHERERAVRLAEHVITLHHWIQNGGFLPYQWRREE